MNNEIDCALLNLQYSHHIQIGNLASECSNFCTTKLHNGSAAVTNHNVTTRDYLNFHRLPLNGIAASNYVRYIASYRRHQCIRSWTIRQLNCLGGRLVKVIEGEKRQPAFRDKLLSFPFVCYYRLAYCAKLKNFTNQKVPSVEMCGNEWENGLLCCHVRCHQNTSRIIDSDKPVTPSRVLHTYNFL